MQARSKRRRVTTLAKVGKAGPRPGPGPEERKAKQKKRKKKKKKAKKKKAHIPIYKRGQNKDG